MLRWEKMGRSVKGDGNSTSYYQADGKAVRYHIESRKRPIPHANRSGSWSYTSYFLIVRGQEKEYYRLQDAKAAAEEMEGEDRPDKPESPTWAQHFQSRFERVE